MNGITRKVDQLGRVVLPIELRRALGLKEGALVEISADGERMTLTKVEDRCVFCGSVAELREFTGKRICETCVAAVSRAPSPEG